MSYLANCPECRRKVTVVTVLGGENLDRALETDGDVEVVCFLYEHRWKLNRTDKKNLRKHLAWEKRLVSWDSQARLREKVRDNA